MRVSLLLAMILAGPAVLVPSPLLAQAPATNQPTPPTRGTKAVPEQPARVFVFASFDAECRPAQAPGLTIDQPPGKGSVSFRENQATVVQYSLSGKCIGTRLQGTGVYYTAAKGQRGSDTFTISARTPNGAIATRTFNVEIADD